MTADDRRLLEDTLKEAEGFRTRAYQDSVGVWTIGYGTNLQELRIDRTLAEQFLRQDLTISELELAKNFDWYGDLSSTRQAVLIEMHYNLGLSRLLQFHKFLAAAERGDADEAAVEMLHSKWANQVGRRAERLAARWREG